MRDSAFMWFIDKKAKIFSSIYLYIDIFLASVRKKNPDWSMKISFFESPNHISRLT